MDEDLVGKAERSVFSVRQAFSEQAYNGSLQEVQTSPTEKIYVGGPWGSAFCFHEAGDESYLITCEHVRQDTHLWSNRVKQKLASGREVLVKSTLSKPPAFVVVCPYEGGGAALNWQHSWRAEFVAHTGIEDPTYQNPVLEELAVAGRILPDETDLAILRLVAPVAPATAPARPQPLRFSKKPLVERQNCWVLGYPSAGGTTLHQGSATECTPTPVPVTFANMNGNALKVTGAQIMPGHSGGPLVTESGTVVGWNFGRNNELSWCRPIAAAEKCIRLVLPGAWEQLFASAEAEGAHDLQQQQAANVRLAAGLHMVAELLAGDGQRPTAASSSDSGQGPPPPSDSRSAGAPAPVSSLPCSPLLDPVRWAGKEPLFGREDDERELKEALKSDHRYYLVLGAAGLGKTAIVKSVARQLVASGSSGSRFSAIVFVELRARETEDAVRSAVRDAIKTAGVGSSDPMTLPHDALLILDNADDPYKLKNDDGWFEKRFLPELDAWGCTILMTMRDEGNQSLFEHMMQAHLTHKHSIGALKKEAGLELLHHLMQKYRGALTEEQEQSILGVCGGNAGVSPLMLSVICGVLCNNVLAKPHWKQDHITNFVSKLREDLTGESRAFQTVQRVMKSCIEYVPAELRAAFLKLHLFPDQFSLEDAASLWGVQQEQADEMLWELIKFALVTVHSDRYLILDHIWLFATRLAEDPKSPWLSREGFAQAVHNLIKVVSVRWKKDERPPIVAASKLPRLFHAGRFHASKCLEQLRPVEGTSRPVMTSSEPSYRSLGADEDCASSAAYGKRLDGQGTGPAEKKPGFSPLEAKHLSQQLIEDARALVQDAAAEILGNVEPAEPALAPAAAKATGKRKERGTEEPL